MAKLTQKELDQMVLDALGEGEGKEGKRPSALEKLLEVARGKKAETEAGEGETE